MNEGKAFENDIKESCKSQEIFCMRLNDTSLSYIKEKQARFTPTSRCDFILYRLPNMFSLECKSTKYKSMSFQLTPDRPEGMIKAHQIKSLIELSQVEGIFAGFLLNFRDEENRNNNTTYWWDIRDFSNFVTEIDKSSFNRLDIVQHNGIVVESKLKRIRTAFDMKGLLNRIQEKEDIDGLGI